jgi:hypothetical protein
MASDRPDAHELPTPRSTLQARYVAVLLTCRSCFRSQHADLEALVAGGRGDVPLMELRWWCSNCRSRLVDFVVTSRRRPAHGFRIICAFLSEHVPDPAELVELRGAIARELVAD